MAGFFSGTPTRIDRIQKFDPQRQQGFNQILQMALSKLQGGGGDFGPIEELARYKHKTETIPSLHERFTTMGAQRSSGFQEALGKSGEGLDLGLAALRSQHESGQQGQLMELLGMGLSPQEELVQYEGREGAAGPLSQYASKYLPMLGGMAGTAIGGPVGGAVGTGGGALISLLLSLLGEGGGSQQQQPSGSVSYSQPY